ncbi:MAG: hypothetical protein A3B24_00730 [Candidatus Wildermuthbacteria bacterium RIFCSPLOWO2_01_FULL_48_16]|uniref:Uncharacterized protein n=1 Tax=Candidatus Wildermuthbacteria bacterium RIFCSPLOWO2_01_FULL_48_16 TaxID=1802461 RepID=A0A1G2RNP2_9BACT|nr:MAG: hypothetical protein A3B24_00730 [Candidatus Wildermuthbacteria bacterium RIFCSPLOWO2_01_FULL_48_16]
MPRTLGGWLFLTSAGLLWLLELINFLLVGIGFLAVTNLGLVKGFDRFSTVTCVVFGLMFFGDLVTLFLVVTRYEKVLESLWPNLVIVFVRFVYLAVAAIFFWGFYERWQGGFLFPAEGFDLFFLCVISSFAVVNTPWLFFHLVLCIPKHRRWIQKMNEELKCRMKEQ